MQIRRLGYALGAEITGLDLKGPLDDADVAGLRRAWLEHIVLCFPGQDLDPEELMAFCGRFGELDDYASRTHFNRPDYPTVAMIVNKPFTLKGKTLQPIRADEWHTDLSFSNRPATATFLHAKNLPEVGGDTMFANMFAAYDALSPGMKALPQPLEGVHDVTLSPDYPRQSPELQAERRRRNPPIVHRVVQRHPETGRKLLYLGAFLREFLGMTREESLPLIAYLNRHATRYEFTYRHRWRLDDLIVWDNRSSMHYAVQDFDRAQERHLNRCSLQPPISGSFLDERLTGDERATIPT